MVNRRDFLSTTLRGAAGAALSATFLDLLRAQQPPAPGRRPNVLFIVADDLNDWIGCLGGHPDVKTPNIDRLASRGVTFTNAFCSAPACNPSRASLLTGMLPSNSGVYINNQPWRRALPDAVTLQQHFMAGGYEVAGCGKIFHESYPDDASWHEYFPMQRDPMPPNRPLNRIPGTGPFDWGPVDVPDSQMSDTKMVDWAVNWLKREHDKPFFLGVGLYRPHLPWYVPRKYFDLYDVNNLTLPNVNPNDLDDVPAVGREMALKLDDHRKVLDTDNWRRAVQGYLACISYADANVGRVLDALDKSGQADNTIIVFWGDHGWHLGEKLHWRKFALWEEATHAPLLMVVPGLTAAGARCKRTVSFIDLYPTLSDITGLPQRKECQGVTFRSLLADPDAQWDRPALTTHERGNHSVRSERWRYIRYHDGSEELYDHLNDELEWTNLASQPRFSDVKKDLARWLPKHDAPNAPGR